MTTCHYYYSYSRVLPFTLYDWKSADSLFLIGPSWSDFSLALVLFGLYECVCNNSLTPFHGEIIKPRYSDGHYRSTTCITSSPLISQNGCRGAHQQCCFVNSVCVCVCSLWFFWTAGSARTLVLRGVCTHVKRAFSKTWRQRKKHPTHNWSAIKESPSWICVRLGRENQSSRLADEPTTLAPPGLITVLGKKWQRNTQNTWRGAIVMRKWTGCSALSSPSKRRSGDESGVLPVILPHSCS